MQLWNNLITHTYIHTCSLHTHTLLQMICGQVDPTVWSSVLGRLPWSMPSRGVCRHGFHSALVPLMVLTVSALSLQVLQGAQLIAVASSDPTATGMDGSPLQGSDIQVQYVQLAPVTDHTTAAQVGLCGQVLGLL